MKDVFAQDRRTCRTCGIDPVVICPRYEGFYIQCPACKRRTSQWMGLYDAWLEWEQVINKEVSNE